MSKKKDKGVFEEIAVAKIGGFDYSLRFVREDRGLEAAVSAEFSSRRQEISVMEKFTKGESILHECLHGCDWQIAGSAEDRPEDYIHRLSYFFYAFMRDNPELVIQMLRENREKKIDEILRKITGT